jgi:proteasome lid subunit RPN8/RPN11
MERSKDSPLVSWSAPQCWFTIEYSPRVLDDIRLAVVGAFFSAPRGGVEIGGILLGDFQKKRLRITGYAPVECEHAFGPSFTLSDRDQERLAELLGRRSLPGRQTVGWYHSHTRSEIFFSDADLEIHRRFFPEPWQTALVLRPHTFQPTRAGFFFREAVPSPSPSPLSLLLPPHGSIRGEASYGEFALEPLPLRPGDMEAAAGAAPAPAPRRKPAVSDAAPQNPLSPGPAPPPETPASAESPRLETLGKGPRRWRKVLLAIGACLAAVFLAYEALDIVRLQADLKAQTERAKRAEKSLADARNQLKIEREKGAAKADAGK